MTGTDIDVSVREPVEEESAPQSLELKPAGFRRRWSTAFLMAGSALLGATAIALWNRRTIARLRTEFQAQRPDRAATTENEIV